MKFLVVDDHALIREAMRGVLGELQGDAVILEAASSDQAMDAMQQHPDIALVLLDLKLPDRDGIEVLGELRERYPATSIVMLSAFNDRDNVVRALDNGALGFIPKTDSRDVLIGALKLILAGGIYIPPGSSRSRTGRLYRGKQAVAREAAFTDGAWPYGTAGRRPGTDDAGQEQQADLPRARFGRADREKSRVSNSQDTRSHEPDRGGSGRCSAGLGVAAACPLTMPAGPTLLPRASAFSRRDMMARSVMGLAGLCRR
jgi:DNA-binding NarL/FixJ family response regulator